MDGPYRQRIFSFMASRRFSVDGHFIFSMYPIELAGYQGRHGLSNQVTSAGIGCRMQLRLLTHYHIPNCSVRLSTRNCQK